MLHNIATIRGYHAHVYFDPDTRATARAVRHALTGCFDVRVGGFHDEPGGPHPKGSYQIGFTLGQFDHVVPWLMLNRQGLDVLVHPLTGDEAGDHEHRALWLGTPQPLDIDFLRSLPAVAALATPAATLAAAPSPSQPALLTQDSCND